MEKEASEQRPPYFTYVHAAFIIGAVFTYLVDQVLGKSVLKILKFEVKIF